MPTVRTTRLVSGGDQLLPACVVRVTVVGSENDDDDDLVSIASLDLDLTVEDLIDEFELTPHTAYIERAQQAQDDRR